MKFILGKKIGNSRVFNEKGESIPVTLVEAGPCTVTQIKTKDNDGYEAVQIGFIVNKRAGKSQNGKAFRYVKEFKGSTELKIGDEIKADFFTKGDKVKVQGVSKGKGFAGVMKRWGFSGAATSSHGTKHNNRKAGSIGSAFPQRVFKGKKMAGRMGSDKTTVKNIEIIDTDVENNIILIKGATPGIKGGLLIIEG